MYDTEVKYEKHFNDLNGTIKYLSNKIGLTYKVSLIKTESGKLLATINTFS